ncbi:kinase-like domain-containing protein [Apodospora peruviana]|uniref:Kinase-like domain-containing protein n=1 Tax=Apodospora peruviana TaxID=516989 RepID=A0AAE0M3P1_9PEZI|nr:kinase-like domain-containing protein [Apodospora peruviana]
MSAHSKLETQHQGTEDLAINNTPFRRLLTLLALKTTARLYRRHGDCVPISPSLIVKSGRFVHLTEAATMQFVAKNTSNIPVPKVWCSFVHKNRAYIVMERIQGKEFVVAWPDLPEPSRQRLLSQLRQMLQELRSLRPPSPGVVQSCVGGSLHDARITRALPRFGPFKTIHEFHFWLRDSTQIDKAETKPSNDHCDDQEWTDLKEMAARQDGPWPEGSVFTHADLNPCNVLLRGDEVVGIIDWAFSGWYPHYWEYTSAWHGNALRPDWQALLDRILERQPDEVIKMEKTRQKWWGEI